MQPRRFNIILGEFICQLNFEADLNEQYNFIGASDCSTVEKAIKSAHENVLFLLDNKNASPDTDDMEKNDTADNKVEL